MQIVKNNSSLACNQAINTRTKKRISTLFFFLSLLLIGLASCEKDKNEETPDKDNDEVVFTNENVSVCVNISTLLSDVSGTENNLPSSELTSRPYMNGRVRIIRKSNHTIIETKYTDSEGCLSFLRPEEASKYYIEVTPVLKLDDDSYAYAYTGSRSSGEVTDRITENFPSSGDLTITETSYNDVFNVMSTIGFVTDRVEAFNANRDLHVIVNTTHNSGSHIRRRDSHLELHIFSGHRNSRYVIAHEFGHIYQYYFNPNYENDCGYTSSSCRGFGSHSMRSAEYSSCGASEGYAHFFAFSTWHEQSNLSAKFRYYKGNKDAIPVYSGTTEYPLKYRETECTDPSNSDKYTELDFMRTYAEMYKNGSSVKAITEWLSAANFGRDTAFSKLDDEANDIGGSLRTNWQAAYPVMLR